MASFKVKFIDYGNEDIVTNEDIVSSTLDIPDFSDVDEYVHLEDDKRLKIHDVDNNDASLIHEDVSDVDEKDEDGNPKNGRSSRSSQV